MQTKKQKTMAHPTWKESDSLSNGDSRNSCLYTWMSMREAVQRIDYHLLRYSGAITALGASVIRSLLAADCLEKLTASSVKKRGFLVQTLGRTWRHYAVSLQINCRKGVRTKLTEMEFYLLYLRAYINPR